MKFGLRKPQDNKKVKQEIKPVEKSNNKIEKKIVSKKKHKYDLPTEIVVKNFNLTDLIILIYGEKKIGKTTLAVQFPNCLFFNCEKGTRGVDCLEVNIDNWGDFKGYLIRLENTGAKPYKTFAIDTVDKLYKMCFDYVCSQEDFTHPSKVGYGVGWSAISDEFTKQLERLINLRKGIVFISHATEKEFLERGGGKYEKIVPTMKKQCMEVINAIADIMIFYGYFGSKRVLSVVGMDSLESGTRMGKHFWVKGKYEVAKQLIVELLEHLESDKATEKYLEETVTKIESLRVHTIPAGISEEQTYFNLNLAFMNRQKNSGSELLKYAPNVEKLAMQQKRNR